MLVLFKTSIYFIYMKRCKWLNLNDSLYIKYHDEEWGKLSKDEHYLYEMFILETFQAGLSWSTILHKREYFEEAYCNFDIEKVILFNEIDINNLMNNKLIIRNKLKIKASISNSIIYKKIINENGSFFNYLIKFFNEYPIYEINKTTNKISDSISKDLYSKGMKFVGSTTIYSYLQAIGLIASHDEDCFLNKKP